MWKADPDEIIAAVNRGHQTLASTHRRRAAIWKVADLVFQPCCKFHHIMTMYILPRYEHKYASLS